MPEASDKFGMIHQNLVDAGCNPETIETCMELIKRNKNPDVLQLLLEYRKELLKAVRRGQKEIDCLDYLVYKLDKKTEERT